VNFRIAFWSQLMLGSADNDSLFSGMKLLAGAMAERGHEVYLFVPKKAYDKKHQPEGVKLIEVDGIGNFYGTFSNMTRVMELVHPRRGELMVDAIVTQQIYNVYALRGMFHDAGVNGQPIIAAYDNIALPSGFIRNARTRKANFISNVQARAMGYAMADRTYFESGQSYAWAMDAARIVLSGNGMKAVKDGARIMSVGVDLEKCQAISDSVEKYDEFSLFFGARLNYTKRPELMLKKYVRHIASGSYPRVIITSPKVDLEFWREIPDAVKELVDFRSNLSRDEFLEVAAKCHVVLYPSSDEMLPYGVLEMLAVGLVPIFADELWVKSVFEPVIDAYPYVYESPDQIDGMLLYIAQNYEEAQRAVKPLRDFVCSAYDMRVTRPRILEDLEELCKARVELCNTPACDLFAEAALTIPDGGEKLDSFLKRSCEHAMKMTPTLLRDMTYQPLHRPTILAGLRAARNAVPDLRIVGEGADLTLVRLNNGC